MDYSFGENGSIYSSLLLDPSRKPITFLAERIRNERTGVHARIFLSYNGTELAWDNMNVEKDPERVRLTNSAYKVLKYKMSAKDEYLVVHLKRDLDAFCRGLWGAYLSQIAPTEEEGDPDMRIEYLLRPFIVRGGGSILFGSPGGGKSYTAQTMATCIDAGIDFLGQPVCQTKVLYVNLERWIKIWKYRQARINKCLGLPERRPLGSIQAKGKTLAFVAPAIERYVKANEVGLVILDSLSRAGYGDLQGNQEANSGMDTLNDICDSWLALGHDTKHNKEKLYGSIMFEAAADIMIKSLSEIKEGQGLLGVGLQSTKQNDIAPTGQYIYVYEFGLGEVGLTNIRKSQAGEFSDIEKGKRGSPVSRIMDYLMDVGNATAEQVADGLGMERPNVVKEFKHSGRFVEVKMEGKKKYYGVLEKEYS